MSLLAFWCASICSLPFGWLVFFSLALKWLRARCGWGDPGVAWSRVLAKFYLQCAKFYAASTFHFHFFILILLPSSCTPAWSRHATLGSPPPFGRPSTEEATWYSEYFLPLPSKICSITGTNCVTFDCWKIYFDKYSLFSCLFYFWFILFYISFLAIQPLIKNLSRHTWNWTQPAISTIQSWTRLFQMCQNFIYKFQ